MAFKVSYSCRFGIDRLQKKQTMGGGMFENQSKLHGGDKRHIKERTKTKNLKINGWVIFHPYASCPYLKMGLCDLFPALKECITYWWSIFTHCTMQSHLHINKLLFFCNILCGNLFISHFWSSPISKPSYQLFSVAILKNSIWHCRCFMAIQVIKWWYNL